MSLLPRAISLLPIGFICITTIACDGCDNRATHAGENGNFQLSYEPADYDTKFNRPLATGSELTTFVLDMDSNAVQRIDSVHSSNEKAITVQPNTRAQNTIQLIS